MVKTFLLPTSLVLLGLAGCTNPPMATTDMTHSTAPRSASQAPQPANSLPTGAAVSAPIASGTGAVGTVGTSPRRY